MTTSAAELQGLLKEAEAGNVGAQYKLGRIYEDGIGVKKDKKQAYEWYFKEAERDHALAQFSLGSMYRDGNFVVKDAKQAAEWYQKSIEGCRKEAEAGDPDAQTKFGYAYYIGQGIAQDYKTACEWWQKAAAQGSALAQSSLGFAYAKAQGVAQDYKAACEWWQKAADQGTAGAQNNLGVAYTQAQGVAQNYKAAFEWFQKAAMQGHAGAQNNLGFAYAQAQGVAQDYKAAFEWFQKAAAEGDVLAQNNLGLAYAQAQGVAQDYKTACEWYQKAAMQGHAGAQNSLGSAYDQGQGVTQDYKEAFEWYQKAAKQGHAEAQYSLGSTYDFGEGVAQDHKEAFEWYQKAATQGHAAAQYNLGFLLYRDGQGVSKNEKIAREWYRKAAEQGYVSSHGEPALLWAAWLGLAECIDVLVERSTNLIDVRDKRGNTPLILALKGGHIAYARALLEANADVTISNNQGKTPLHYVAENDSLSVVIPLLFQRGAKWDAKDVLGNMPLSIAKRRNKAKTAQLLEVIPIITSCFNPGHLQLLANLIKKSYLEVMPEDYPLIKDNMLLGQLINNQLKRASEKLFVTYQQALATAQKTLSISSDKLNKFLIEILHGCLKEFYLYPKPAEFFWKPYLDMLLFQDGKANEVLPQFLPRPLSKLVIDYHGGIFPKEVAGFSEEGEYSSGEAVKCSDFLLNARIQWIRNVLNDGAKKSSSGSKDPQAVELDFEPGDRKQVLDRPANKRESRNSPLLYAFDLSEDSKSKAEKETQKPVFNNPSFSVSSSLNSPSAKTSAAMGTSEDEDDTPVQQLAKKKNKG